ncbi:hypothetical protein [Sulfobacillus sp. hq2]|uniref:hypothetical protein n=1 Tax=Sulfobacillus TaxID=28033 RepID=UPI000CD23ECB|nr:hypothetical protein [Sulfobacillus sp. hq2]POB11451.1 hypothetical protein CO251_04720 [Sulfobacillus sp. hq2]
MNAVLWASVSLAALVGTIGHEAAHIVVARHYGARWHGMRWHKGRLTTVIDMTGLSRMAYRWVAAAGLAVDGLLSVLALLSVMLMRCTCLWLEGPLIWGLASLLVNGCPFIPHSDGWQMIFGVRRFAIAKD